VVAVTLKWWSEVAEVMIRMINRAQSGGRWWLATTNGDVLIYLLKQRIGKIYFYGFAIKVKTILKLCKNQFNLILFEHVLF